MKCLQIKSRIVGIDLGSLFGKKELRCRKVRPKPGKYQVH